MKMKTISVMLIALFLITSLYADSTYVEIKFNKDGNMIKDYEFKGHDDINVSFKLIKKSFERKVIYFQVYYNNYWTTIDSLVIGNSKNIDWKINKPYLSSKKLKARLKVIGIKKESLNKIERRIAK